MWGRTRPGRAMLTTLGLSRVPSRTGTLKSQSLRINSCNYQTIWVELYKIVFTIGYTQFSLLYKNLLCTKVTGDRDSLAGKVFAMFIRT